MLIVIKMATMAFPGGEATMRSFYLKPRLNTEKGYSTTPISWHVTSEIRVFTCLLLTEY
jgi:hypothetical protein